MYSKQEAAKQRQAFWTTFGQYMQPVLSADGEQVNWINYRTGVAHIQFRMDAGQRQACIGIVLTHPDLSIRQEQYGQLLLQQSFLRETMQEDWIWEAEATDEQGKTQSRVYTLTEGVNINRTEDWPRMISFLKPRIIALDTFWSMSKYAFEH
ncbi:MAG: DUF4268 domain-containing protein [Chitinophagaceae bacterium]|nr:DUF4268 domain-containing protein [Chitinophagaceae bacterium]